MVMNDIDLGWLAGIFEGEGCIYITQDGRTLRLTIPSTDLETVEKVKRLTGIGTIHQANYVVKSGESRVIYRWQAQKLLEVQDLLRTLLPHFGKRRTAKAIEGLAIEPNPNGYGPRNPQRLEVCRRGLHEMVGNNVAVAKNGNRRCRLCRNERERDRARSNRESLSLS
jgi:hypothetical protein